MAPALKNPTPLAKAKAKAIPKDLVQQLPPPQSAIAAVTPAPMVTATAALESPVLPSPSSSNLTVLPQLLLSASQPVNKTPPSAFPSTPQLSSFSSSFAVGNVNTPPPASSSAKSAKKERASTDIDNQGRLQIQNYLYTVSGQLKVATIQELEHDYAKPANNHPDPQVRAKAAKFLFMKHFPRHLNKQPAIYATSKDDEMVDVMSFEEQKKIPFLTPRVS